MRKGDHTKAKPRICGGYLIDTVEGKIIYEHRKVWEQYHGRKIPTGLRIHHIDGNRLNNSVENLQLVNWQSHQRIHNGWKLVHNQWLRYCRGCGQYLALNKYHMRQNGTPRELCIECRKRISREHYESYREEKLQREREKYHRIHQSEKYNKRPAPRFLGR